MNPLRFLITVSLINLFFCFFFTDSYNTQDSMGREAISLTLLYHFHPLHRHLDSSRAITTEGSSLHITSSRTRTGNLFKNADFFLEPFKSYKIE